MTKTDNVVAGGPGDFMTVRHLNLSGSHAEIGLALAEEARRTYGWRPGPADDRTVARARRTWFERHWPQHAARTAAVAEMLGLDPDATVMDGLSSPPEGSGCSVIWCPPESSSDGRGRLGRNYDFFTLSQRAIFSMMSPEGPQAASSDEPAWCSKPYVITTRPDDGLAATVLTMDRLDTCMEGINEAGLTIALLMANIETTELPDLRRQVGLDTLELPRFVLESATTAEEAKQVLLGAKQYDGGMPVHYVIADATGDGFVWERGSNGVEHIIESESAVCATNHFLHRHSDPATLPKDNAESWRTYQRYSTLTKRAASGSMSPDYLEESLREVGFDARTAGKYPMRTLWRTMFDATERTMSARFYLGDTPDGDLRMSEEITFSAKR